MRVSYFQIKRKLFLITFKLSCQNMHDEKKLFIPNEICECKTHWGEANNFFLIINSPSLFFSLTHSFTSFASCEMKINDSKWSGILASSHSRISPWFLNIYKCLCIWGVSVIIWCRLEFYFLFLSLPLSYLSTTIIIFSYNVYFWFSKKKIK